VNSALFSPLVEQALRTAAKAHRDQLRKSSDVPYVSHPAAVALILARCGFDDPHILAAALLHDVIEDTELRIESLAAEFPPEVVEIVAAASERKTDDGGNKRPWKQRKIEHLQAIRNAGRDVKAVVIADKLHNLGCMLLDLETHGETLWDRFNASKEETSWYHEAMLEAVDCDDERIRRLQSDCHELLTQLRSS